MKTVAAIHTAMPMVEPTKELFNEHLPGVKLINIVDDSLIQEVIKAGEVTPNVRKRLYNYYFSAVDAGADIIFNTCSSIGVEAQLARDFLSIPLVKIDDAMAEEAVNTSKSIGVMATLPTTLQPTIKLIESFALQANKQVKIVEGLAKGAFEAVISGDKEKHDHLILEAAKKISSSVDIIVLAQGSMARMQQTLANATGKKVLASPLMGVLSLKKELEKIS
ncbi:MAG: aspartate/glutamate racemase family protein [Bacteroidales bacterium]|nr:aspartate/glutamate racemase family protein [Bacteroidales bacterium]